MATPTTVGEMTHPVRRLTIDSKDPVLLGRFWSMLLERPITYLQPKDVRVSVGAESELVCVASSLIKGGKNRVHLDLASTSLDHQGAIVDRAEGLGAVPVDIGQGVVPWVVLADPDGNEFCVLEPREEYSDVGPVAAVVIDALDPPALARFWSQLTGLAVTRAEPEFASIRQEATFWLEFVKVPTPKAGTNRVRIVVDGLPADVVTSDPEGNEFSVVKAIGSEVRH